MKDNKDETLCSLFEEAVLKYGSREFVSDDLGKRYTYSQMNASADAFAAGLEQLMIKAGDTVSMQITPRSEFLVALLGCLKIGAVPAPLGMCFVEGELSEILDKIESRLHIAMREYRGEDREKMYSQLRQHIPVLYTDNCAFSRADGSKPKKQHKGRGEDITLILCTSGTTKGSKAALFTNESIIYSERVFNEHYGLTANDSIFMPAPLNHATGLHHGIISPMLRGAGLVLQERFECSKAVEILNREKCTYSMGATPFVYDLIKQLDESGRELPNLKFYICGGAPVPASLVKHAYDAHNILVCECYGSTESVPHIGVKPADCLENAGATAGTAMGEIQVKIVDKDRKELPIGSVGEEASKGKNIFAGYKNDPELTAEAIDGDGWFYSGDLAVMDEKGQVKIVGRIKDIIIRGGENLNSNRIDEGLEGYPNISDHAVIGMPDERLGERICAFVVPTENAVVTKDSICRYLKEKGVIKRYWPERVEMIDKIPRTESGKIKKNCLSQELQIRMEGKQ